MSVTQGGSGHVNPPQQYWLLLGVVLALLLGLGAFAWFDQMLGAPALAALMAGGGVLLFVILLVLTFELQLALAQREELKKEIADLRAREHSLQVQAHYDGLTGLVNRRLVTDRCRFQWSEPNAVASRLRC